MAKGGLAEVNQQVNNRQVNHRGGSGEVSSCEAVRAGHARDGVLPLCAGGGMRRFPAQPRLRRNGNAGIKRQSKGIWWMPWH